MCEHEHNNCHDLLSSLSEYVDGELSPDLCAELEKHLCECERCRIVVDTMKKTVELYQEMPSDSQLPDEVRSRLFARLDLEDFRRDEKDLQKK